LNVERKGKSFNAEGTENTEKKNEA